MIVVSFSMSLHPLVTAGADAGTSRQSWRGSLTVPASHLPLKSAKEASVGENELLSRFELRTSKMTKRCSDIGWKLTHPVRSDRRRNGRTWQQLRSTIEGAGCALNRRLQTTRA
jgi:hypothetical protein